MIELDEYPKLSSAAAEEQTPCFPSRPALNPQRWVDAYGDALFGFAVLRVCDRAIAQDLVQETFLAGIKGMDNFAGRSSERAWLFGILRNKLTDHYRQQSREIPLADLEATLPEEQDLFAANGLRRDEWLKELAPKPWETPEQFLIQTEFQEVFRRCLSRLPGKTAQVFLLREVDGLSSEEICERLGVSANNLWIMLHRARMGLRRCLEIHWFGKSELAQTPGHKLENPR